MSPMHDFLTMRGFTLEGGGAAPLFYLLSLPAAGAHIVVTSEDGDGEATEADNWLLGVYDNNGPWGDCLFSLQGESGSGKSLAAAINGARAFVSAYRPEPPSPRYTANIVHVGGVYRDGDHIASCRGIDSEACAEAARIAAALNAMEGR